MLKTILSIAGKPGLYKLISSGKNMLIVETVDAAKKRIPAYGQDKVISLADIAMYTDAEEVPLSKVLESVKNKRERGLWLLLTIRKYLQTSCMLILQKFFPTMTVTVCTQVTSRSCCHGTISW